MSTTNPRIEERIRSMERADYDEIARPTLPERQLPQQFAFLRITELARFWDDSKSGEESLVEHQQRLITSFYGVRIPWTYVVLGEGGVASVLVGLPCQEGNAKSWERLFSAQLPGSSWRMDRSAQHVLSTLTSFPLVAGLSGNPSVAVCADRQSKVGYRSAGIEALFETMSSARWAYVVLSRPLTDQEVAHDLRGFEGELLEMNGAYRRRGSAEENNNPLVTRYTTLLESAHQKLLQGQRDGMWEVQSYFLVDSTIDCQRGVQALHAAFGGPTSEPQPFRIKMGARSGIGNLGTPMTTRLNTAEVAMLASLPRREVAGLQVTEHVTFGMSGSGGIDGGDCVALGLLMSGGTGTSRWYEVPKNSLGKHTFIAGVPGSGKTRTCMYVLSQLWREHGIPWLVLEPSMKSEYRALLRTSFGADLKVFTAGDESVAPLRLNPLEVAEGVHVQTHIGGLATLFQAAFVMEAPMPYVLDEAFHRVYEERGWDLVTGGHCSRGIECQPTISDLLETCNRVVHDLGYDNQLKSNIRAALRTRLTSLMRGAKGRMLNVRQSVSMEYLLSTPTVIEFSTLGSDDEKAFLLGCILLRLAQHRQTGGLSSGDLRHVTLIEEAHRLLSNVPSTAGISAANPRRQAVESFSNMLAELRAYGEGLMVVDQMPSKLIPDVIRNSGLKIVHRLTAEEERAIVGGAMALNEAQTRFLSGLSAGQAIVYSDGSVNACRISIPDHAGHEGYLQDSPSNAEVSAHMQGRVPKVISALCPTGPAIPDTAPENDLRRCMSTCPAGACPTRDAVEGYVSQHAGETEAEFQRAVAAGFEALWQFGNKLAHVVWRRGESVDDGPFCVVMAVAGRMGMADGDVQILRRHMARLRNKHRRGGLS